LVAEPRVGILAPVLIIDTGSETVNDPWKEHAELVEAVQGLCDSVRDAVRPHLGTFAAKDQEGRGASGDTTFGIDEVAELEVASFLDARPEIAYYTEDRGLVVRDKPSHLFIIDPIDGTRPAAAGLESCCVSVAVAPSEGRDPMELTMGDVFLGVVTEIKSRAVFTGLRGGGARIAIESSPAEPSLSSTADLHDIFWTAGYRGRPAEDLTMVIGELIDLSSVDGGYFDLGSATYSITRVVTGQMDAYVDVGQRMVEEVPGVRQTFLDVGHGNVLNNYPYDLAAAVVIASECGCTVSDASGGSLDGHLLVPAEGWGQLSSLITSNKELHRKILASLDSGMVKLARKYGHA
jgi:myo-inositol-1(or 4)-monophosphatase